MPRPSDRVWFTGGGPYNGQHKLLPDYPDGYRFRVVMNPARQRFLVAPGKPLAIENTFRVGEYELWWDRSGNRVAIWRGVEN